MDTGGPSKLEIIAELKERAEAVKKLTNQAWRPFDRNCEMVQISSGAYARLEPIRQRALDHINQAELEAGKYLEALAKAGEAAGLGECGFCERGSAAGDLAACSGCEAALCRDALCGRHPVDDPWCRACCQLCQEKYATCHACGAALWCANRACELCGERHNVCDKAACGKDYARGDCCGYES